VATDKSVAYVCKTFRFPCRAKLSSGGEASHLAWSSQFSIRIHICQVTLERVVMAGGRAKQATQLEDSHGRPVCDLMWQAPTATTII
jgi:hypothetical protein